MQFANLCPRIGIKMLFPLSIHLNKQLPNRSALYSVIILMAITLARQAQRYACTTALNICNAECNNFLESIC